MSLEAFDAAALEPLAMLPVALQEAALAPPPVLTKGASPRPVTLLVELDVASGT